MATYVETLPGNSNVIVCNILPPAFSLTNSMSHQRKMYEVAAQLSGFLIEINNKAYDIYNDLIRDAIGVHIIRPKEHIDFQTFWTQFYKINTLSEEELDKIILTASEPLDAQLSMF